MEQTDITSKLISESVIRTNLTAIFTDAIIVDNNFFIVAVSESISKITGFEAADLEGRPLDHFSSSPSLQDTLKKKLINGFSEKGTVVALRTKNFGFISCQITGFYLGLISDLNGFIVLRVKQLDEINQLCQQLEVSRNELDEFVYRASHDLRGPLATIRGLINLMKLRPSTEEMMNLVDMVDSHAIKMDDRLFGLHYLSESGRGDVDPADLNAYALESTLRSTIEENHPIDNIHFHFDTVMAVYKGINNQFIVSLLNNILLYLLALPKSQMNSMSVAISTGDANIRVIIDSKGFLGSYQLMKAIRQKAPLYSNAVTYSQLIHYYAAQKIAHKIKASLQINFINDDEQNIVVVIPITEEQG
jgi:light-regulated signal transduction histidine kinase (bacteriophytochrome)